MDKEVKYLYLDDIIPNRFQPRENFDEKALKELAVSIKEHGVIQPIIVRQIGEKYEIIAGERRYKASTMAGLTKIPAIITNLDDKESSKVALIENLQRKDLTPIEEARTYQKILELDALTQEELAKTMGKSQSAVSNKLRLLSLTDEVQDALLHEQISERHARSLLSVEDPKRQVELLNKIISTRMTVRELEEEINGTSDKNLEKQETTLPGIPSIDPTVVDVEKIKNESEDIKVEAPKIDIDALLKPVQNVTTPEQRTDISGNIENNIFAQPSSLEVQEPITINEEKPAQEIIGNGLLAGMTIAETKQSQSLFGKENLMQSSTNLFDSNIGINGSFEMKDDKKEENINNENSLFNNNPFEAVKIETVQVQNEEKTNIDINSTIKTVKDTVESIKNNGKKVELEEFDFEDFYQIVIRIDK